MSKHYNAVELIEMAKSIELKGNKFYTYLAKGTDKKELVGLFQRLAQDELDHYKKFEELGTTISESTREESEYVYDPEVGAYLDAIVEFTIFPKEDEVKVMDIVDGLQIAISAEKDSILFYTEMLQYNKGETAELLNNLIKEEKEHLMDLLKIDQEYSNN